MKALLLALLLAFPSFTLAQKPARPKAPAAPKPSLQTKYDKFSNQTRIATQGIEFADVMVDAGFGYSGQAMERPPSTIRILFVAPISTWLPGSRDQLISILLDNKQPALRVLAEHSSTLRAPGVIFGSYGLDLDMATFTKIACATRVEIQAGLHSGELKAKDIQALRDLLSAAGESCEKQQLPSSP